MSNLLTQRHGAGPAAAAQLRRRAARPLAPSKLAACWLPTFAGRRLRQNVTAPTGCPTQQGNATQLLVDPATPGSACTKIPPGGERRPGATCMYNSAGPRGSRGTCNSVQPRTRQTLPPPPPA